MKQGIPPTDSYPSNLRTFGLRQRPKRGGAIAEKSGNREILAGRKFPDLSFPRTVTWFAADCCVATWTVTEIAGYDNLPGEVH